MSIQLISLRFVPKDADGWTSGLLPFGKHITLIKGPNGAGKTPLLLGLAYGLGYSAVFRQDIKEKCSGVELTIRSNESEFRIFRPLGAQIGWVATQDSVDETVAFDSELAFSKWLFELTGIPQPKLTRTGGSEEANVYLSTYLPCFYVDQGKGWQSLYFCPNKFIEDQHQEMLRLTLGLNPRHPFAAKDQLLSERAALLRINDAISHRLAVIKEVEPTSRPDREASTGDLSRRKAQVHKRLNELKDGVSTVTHSTSAFDTKISDLKAEIDRRAGLKAEAETRVQSSQTIASEIRSEIEALSLNVEAADRFRKFCGFESCRLFATPEETYGKSLLYLKDQLKDLDGNGKKLTVFAATVGEEINELAAELRHVESLRAAVITEKGFDSLIRMIEDCSKELVEIETALVLRTRLDDQRLKLANLVERKEATKLRIQDLEDTSRVASGSTVSTRRSDLAEAITRWLGILRTPNLRGGAAFDDRFALVIGGERLSAFSGSTQTRIILAYHAAVSEVALAHSGNHLGFLILDTPMQQELKVTDLEDYIVALRALARKHSGRFQVCLSFSDANIGIQPDDTIWKPTFTFGKDEMFLGKPN